jgi:hypothetical protein
MSRYILCGTRRFEYHERPRGGGKAKWGLASPPNRQNPYSQKKRFTATKGLASQRDFQERRAVCHESLTLPTSNNRGGAMSRYAFQGEGDLRDLEEEHGPQKRSHGDSQNAGKRRKKRTHRQKARIRNLPRKRRSGKGVQNQVSRQQKDRI